MKQELDDSLDRITKAEDDDIENQVNREVVRYWNERVSEEKDKPHSLLRKIRSTVLKFIMWR